MKTHDKKVVVITGASSGIGEATARYLAEKGYSVYAGARSAGVETARGVRWGRVDVTDDASVAQFINWVLTDAGRIDVLVNNAGVSLVGPVEKTLPDEVEWVFDTNVLGPLRMARAALPRMRAQGEGLIINISSVLGFLPAPFMGVYAASKHALEGLSESLDHEVREYGVRVVLVEPTFTNTKLDVNAAQLTEPLGIYEPQFKATMETVQNAIKTAPSPIVAAKAIAAAIERPHRMRQPVGRTATLLSRLRRFMPAKAVDGSLRKTFGFGAQKRSKPALSDLTRQEL